MLIDLAQINLAFRLVNSNLDPKNQNAKINLNWAYQENQTAITTNHCDAFQAFCNMHGLSVQAYTIQNNDGSVGVEASWKPKSNQYTPLSVLTLQSGIKQFIDQNQAKKAQKYCADNPIEVETLSRIKDDFRCQAKHLYDMQCIPQGELYLYYSLLDGYWNKYFLTYELVIKKALQDHFKESYKTMKNAKII